MTKSKILQTACTALENPPEQTKDASLFSRAPGLILLGSAKDNKTCPACLDFSGHFCAEVVSTTPGLTETTQSVHPGSKLSPGLLPLPVALSAHAQASATPDTKQLDSVMQESIQEDMDDDKHNHMTFAPHDDAGISEGLPEFFR